MQPAKPLGDCASPQCGTHGATWRYANTEANSSSISIIAHHAYTSSCPPKAAFRESVLFPLKAWPARPQKQLH